MQALYFKWVWLIEDIKYPWDTYKGGKKCFSGNKGEKKEKTY